MWFEWNSEEEFNSWHEAICQELGYPLTSVNQETGLPDETAAKTEALTQVYSVEDKWIAYVEEIHADGLTETTLRVPIETMER